MPTKEFQSACVCHRNGLWAIGLKSLLGTELSIKWFEVCSYDDGGGGGGDARKSKTLLTINTAVAVAVVMVSSS